MDADHRVLLGKMAQLPVRLHREPAAEGGAYDRVPEAKEFASEVAGLDPTVGSGTPTAPGACWGVNLERWSAPYAAFNDLRGRRDGRPTRHHPLASARGPARDLAFRERGAGGEAGTIRAVLMGDASDAAGSGLPPIGAGLSGPRSRL